MRFVRERRGGGSRERETEKRDKGRSKRHG